MKNKDMPAFFETDVFVKEIGTTIKTKGITKREYFAGLAMQGLLASGNYTTFKDVAVEVSVKLTDLLLEELDKQQGQ